MSKILINGKSFSVEGPLSMINGKWYDGAGLEIDMNNLEGVKEAKTINITIEGSVEKLDVDHCNTITVNGNVRKVDTGSGNVSCRVIESQVTTFGDVISGGFSMTKDSMGVKHMTLNKDCTVYGRRIGDMSETELKVWIADMAKKNKIVTII